MERGTRRLKVFQRITGDLKDTVSRTVEVYNVKDINALISRIFDFGEVQKTDFFYSTFVVSFFDIRASKCFFSAFEGTMSIRYGLPDEDDFICLNTLEYFNMLSVVQSCGEIMDVKIVDHNFLVYFFDIRAARAAFCILGNDKEKNKPIDEVSFLSDSTSSSILVPISPSTSTDNSFEERLSNRNDIFKISLESVYSGEDQRTSLMIRNIPNKYTESMLLETLNKNFSNDYDFFYLPIDLKNRCNMGYAFINLKHYLTVPKLFKELNGKKWEKFKSEKVCQLTYARVQGKISLLGHFQKFDGENDCGLGVRVFN